MREGGTVQAVALVVSHIDFLKICTLSVLITRKRGLFGPWAGGGQYPGQEAQVMAHRVVAGLFQGGVKSWQVDRVSGFHASPCAGDELLPGCQVSRWFLFLNSSASPQDARTLLPFLSSHLQGEHPLPAL